MTQGYTISALLDMFSQDVRAYQDTRDAIAHAIDNTHARIRASRPEDDAFLYATLNRVLRCLYVCANDVRASGCVRVRPLYLARELYDWLFDRSPIVKTQHGDACPCCALDDIMRAIGHLD